MKNDNSSNNNSTILIDQRALDETFKAILLGLFLAVFADFSFIIYSFVSLMNQPACRF